MSKNIAIVTGASGGFGKEFAKLLVEEDLDEVWIIARNGDKLNAVKQELGDKILTFQMDLTDRTNYEILSASLKDADINIKFLVNNAGYAKFCSYDDIDLEQSLNMVDLNVNAVVAFCVMCIPYMEKGGIIINISSESAFFPLPYLNIYSATKVFVRNYTRALNVELKERGVTATAVCPGWMKTDFYARGDIGAKKTAKIYKGMVMPNDVAKKALRDAKRGKDLSIYGFSAKSVHILSKLASQKFAMRCWLKQQKLK